jgi:hypothetical protein
LRSYILGGEFNAAGRRANRPGIPLSIAPRICHDWNEVRLSSSISSFFGNRPGEHRTGRRDSDAFGLAHTDIHGHADTHGHADAHTDAFGNAHGDSDTYGHADTHSYTNTFGNAHGDSDTHGHADAHGHADTFSNTHGDSDTHGHADTFSNTHSDSNTHGHADTLGNTHGDSDAHGHADTHGDANGNTGCRDRPLPLLQGEDCAGFRSLRKARCGGSAESVHRKLEHEPGQAPAIL